MVRAGLDDHHERNHRAGDDAVNRRHRSRTPASPFLSYDETPVPEEDVQLKLSQKINATGFMETAFPKADTSPWRQGGGGRQSTLCHERKRA